MHFCHEELFALLMLLPGLRLVATRLRAWWHRKKGCHHAESEAESHVPS